jgi:hypothetical protein
MVAVVDFVIRNKYNKNKYLCYNSFSEIHWFWGPLRLSEKFRLHSEIMKQLLQLFTEGQEYFVKAINSQHSGIYVTFGHAKDGYTTEVLQIG